VSLASALPRPVVLLCLLLFGSTFSIGAFPVLLPEIGSSTGISDFALGVLAGAFGFARVLADIPAGLYITNHLRRALVLAAACLLAGIVLLASGGPLWMLVLGRGLWGAGHALAMLSGITAIVRYVPVTSRSQALNAFELSAMLGVLGGMLLTGFLPPTWAWNVTLAVASAPLLVAIVLVPMLLRALPSEEGAGDRPWFSRGSHAAGPPAPLSRLAVLAFAAGCVIALAWSAIGQFVLPLRASREFELGRSEVALLIAVPQFIDVLVLLPMGRLADRTSRTRLLGIVLLLFAGGVAAVAYGSLPIVVFGCLLFGIGLAAWMVPVALINHETPASRVAWRTAIYRTGVDAGVFLGPVVSGLLLDGDALAVLGLVIAAALVFLGVAFLRIRVT
jgi:YNFM family putative membrane transporter